MDISNVFLLACEPDSIAGLYPHAHRFRAATQLPRTVRSFSVIGAVGFVVGATLLSLLTRAVGWTPWQARIPSLMTAVLVTWALNRRYTFWQRPARPAAGGAAFLPCNRPAGLHLPIRTANYSTMYACGVR